MHDNAESVTRRETREGTLKVWRWLRPHDRRGLSVVGMLLLDIADPQYDLDVALVCGEQLAPNRHEQVFAVKGKAADGITLADDGRPAAVTGSLKQWVTNPHYGEFTRAKVSFLDASAVRRDRACQGHNGH